MKLEKIVGGTCLLGIVLTASHALASDPSGVWVKVTQVVYEPKDSSAPTHVQIHGAMMLWDNKAAEPYPGYTKPALGYLYYKCPDGEAETCIQEWKELLLNASAPIDECRGIGSRTLPTGTLRAKGTPPENPDLYPIQMGLGSGVTPCQLLANHLKSNNDASGGAGNTETGGAGGSAGSASVSGGFGGTTTTGNPGTGGGTSSVAGAPQSGGAEQGRAGNSATSATGDPKDSSQAENDQAQASGCSVARPGNAASLLSLSLLLGLSAGALVRRKSTRG